MCLDIFPESVSIYPRHLKIISDLGQHRVGAGYGSEFVEEFTIWEPIADIDEIGSKRYYSFRVTREQKPASNPEAIKNDLDQWLSQLKPFPRLWIIAKNGEDRFVRGKSIPLGPDDTGKDNSLFIRPSGVFKTKLVPHKLPTGKFGMVPDESTFNIASPEDYARYEDQIRKAIIQAQRNQSYGTQT